MTAKRLPWDSAFFGRTVGRVDVSREDAASAEFLAAAIRDLDCELTYVFLPGGSADLSGQELHRSALVALGGRLVDRKMTLSKRIGSMPAGQSATITVAKELTAELEGLAYASGWCSRFSLDERLRPFFRPLYRRWLENDLSNGRVFVKNDADGRPIGMVTVSISDEVGRIGLVAVDAHHCGRGIATELMNCAECWLDSHGTAECRVVTQAVNAGGVSLYVKCGYCVERTEEVWHVWHR